MIFFDHWHAEEIGLVEGAIDAVKELQSRGIKVYSATNQDKYRFEYLRDIQGLGELFDGMYGSCNIGFAKPQTEYFQHILDDLKIMPEEVVYFDNTKRHVDAAALLGITSYFVEDKDVLIKQIKTL